VSKIARLSAHAHIAGASVVTQRAGAFHQRGRHFLTRKGRTSAALFSIALWNLPELLTHGTLDVCSD